MEVKRAYALPMTGLCGVSVAANRDSPVPCARCGKSTNPWRPSQGGPGARRARTVRHAAWNVRATSALKPLATYREMRGVDALSAPNSIRIDGVEHGAEDVRLCGHDSARL